MKRFLVLLASACALALALAGAALAQAPTPTLEGTSSTPAVTAILPAMAPSDQAMPVVISGNGFVGGAPARCGSSPARAPLQADIVASQ